MGFDLYYWPTIQGRAEFIRLALEAAGARYRDVAREDGVSAMMARLGARDLATPPFAPPFLDVGDEIISHVAAILAYLGPKLKLVPRDAAARRWTHQIQLTVTDFVTEAHDTHHPVGPMLYYDDQKPEAKRRSEAFLDQRLAKYFDWLETLLTRNPAGPGHLVGDTLTYVDLSAFQLVEGMNYAFPRAMQQAARKWSRLRRLHRQVSELPRVAAYLSSDRRIPFNEDGIFRRYPELDV